MSSKPKIDYSEFVLSMRDARQKTAVLELVNAVRSNLITGGKTADEADAVLDAPVPFRKVLVMSDLIVEQSVKSLRLHRDMIKALTDRIDELEARLGVRG
jgi:hypothetical protein